MLKSILKYRFPILAIGSFLIVVFWEYIKTFSLFLHKVLPSEFLLSSSSFVISLLIPIAIMLLGSKESDNRSEDRWAKKVLKKQIIHFKDILTYIITIIISLMVNQLFPQLTFFAVGIILVSIYCLILLIHKYIEWVDIDGLGNGLAVKEQKALLTSTKYTINEQAFYWQLFLDYACSKNKNSLLFNPGVFYKVWEEAAENYEDQSSTEFYSFCNLLASNFPKLRLNYISPFDEDFYKYCIARSIGKKMSRMNWQILTDAQTSYVEKEASKEINSFSYYRCVNALDELVGDNLSDIKALNYINGQFMRCLLSCKDPYGKELSNTNFQIKSENMVDSSSNTFKQTFSLMSQFIQYVRKHEYHYSMDTSINMLFPKADGITIGRLDYLITCIFNSINSYGANQNVAMNTLNIVKGSPKFGKMSAFPNEETDITNLSNAELNKLQEESYQESLKIYACFYKRFRNKDWIQRYIQKTIDVMNSEDYIKIRDEEQNSEYLRDKSRVYKNILTDFLKYLD